MEELLLTIREIARGVVDSAGMPEMLLGKVTNTDPLEITLDISGMVVDRDMMILTSNVIEKKIPVPYHRHEIKGWNTKYTAVTITVPPDVPVVETPPGHNHSIPETNTEYAITEEGKDDYWPFMACLENNVSLPIDKDYITLNRALEKDDSVILIQLYNGMRYIVLSRVY